MKQEEKHSRTLIALVSIIVVLLIATILFARGYYQKKELSIIYYQTGEVYQETGEVYKNMSIMYCNDLNDATKLINEQDSVLRTLPNYPVDTRGNLSYFSCPK